MFWVGLTLLLVDGLSPVAVRLEGGLRVVLVEEHVVPRVSVQLWYEVGSGDDGPGQAGVCDLCRNLLAERGQRRPAPWWRDACTVSRTLPDTCYFASVGAPDQLGDLLRQEAVRLERRPVTEAEYGAALRRTCPPAAPAESDPDTLLLQAAFPEHPNGPAVAGVGERARGISVADTDSFFQRWFVGGNATLVVVGDFATQGTLRLVKVHFDGAAWSEAPRRARVPDPTAEVVRCPPLETGRGGLELAWVLPRAANDEHVAIDVLFQRLCNSVDGPLQRSLTGAGCWPARWRREAWRRAGLLVLSLDLTDAAAAVDAARGAGRQDELERVVLAALQQASAAVPSEIELNRARALAAREVRNRRAGFADWAEHLGWCEVVAGDARLAEWELPQVEGVRVGDVQRAAALLCEARRVALQRTSAAEEIRPPTATVAATPDGECSWSDGQESGGRPTMVQLDHGVRVIVRRSVGAGFATVQTRIYGRRALRGAADTLMSLGTTVHSVGELRAYLSYHGLDLFPLSGDGPAGLVSRGPVSHVGQMIELHAELIRRPDRSLAASARAAEVGRRLARWLAEIPRPAGEELYLPPGMLGWRVGEPPVTGEELIADDLAALETVSHVAVSVTGDVEPDDVVQAAQDCWGDWRPGR